jgi:superfamily II DNA/RNA helicase
MSTLQKSQAEILSKLGIEQLNPMQLAAQKAIETSKEVILLSPTGTGKTLAFLLPLIQQLDASVEEIQLLIIVPSMAVEVFTVLVGSAARR